MITSTSDDQDVLLQSASGPNSGLRGLMHDWERDGIVDEDESETDLMVLLSGMVGASNRTAGDA